MYKSLGKYKKTKYRLFIKNKFLISMKDTKNNNNKRNWKKNKN